MRKTEIIEGVKVVTNSDNYTQSVKIYFPKEITDDQLEAELIRRGYPIENWERHEGTCVADYTTIKVEKKARNTMYVVTYIHCD